MLIQKEFKPIVPKFGLVQECILSNSNVDKSSEMSDIFHRAFQSLANLQIVNG